MAPLTNLKKSGFKVLCVLQFEMSLQIFKEKREHLGGEKQYEKMTLADTCYNPAEFVKWPLFKYDLLTIFYVNIYHTWYHSKGHFIAVSLTPLLSARNVLHALNALLRNA